MKLAIIGTGNVGGTLGLRWAQKGHQVVFGVRDVTSPRLRKLAASEHPLISVNGIAEAVYSAPLVVLAVPWGAAHNALEAAGTLSEKILVDCTNPVKEGLAGLSLGHTGSAAEQIAAWAPGARVVKAFSTTGTANLQDPVYGNSRISMFLCGDDTDSKATVQRLAEDLDFEVIDTGALSTARYLEPLAMLWIHLAYARGFGSNFAFKILRRESGPAELES